MSEGNPRAPEASSGGSGGSSSSLEQSDMREYGNSAATTTTTGTSSSATGCGCVPVLAAASGLAPGGQPANADPSITISITPTTGGQFDITVDKNESIENLKKIISKRLKVAKERICLLHRERQLRDGTLEENRLQDGSRLTLLPSVETGLLAQRPEQSVMQALESLSDSQVNDFLSGKAPLNLTMRLGDHMMLIQLQLSTVTPAAAQGQVPQQQQQQQQPAAPAAAPPPAPPTQAPTTPTSPPGNPVQAAGPVPGINPELIDAQMHNSPLDNAAARRSSSVFSALSGSPASQQPASCPSKLSLSSSLVNSLATAAAASSLFGPASQPSPPGTPTGFGPTATSPTGWPAASVNSCSQTASPCCPQEAKTLTPPATPPAQRPQPAVVPQQQQQQQQQHRAHAARHHRHIHPARHPYHHPHHSHHHRHVRKLGHVAKPSCQSCAETEVTAVAAAAAAANVTPTSNDPAKCSEFALILDQCDCSKSPKKKPCNGHSTNPHEKYAMATSPACSTARSATSSSPGSTSSSATSSPAPSTPTTPLTPTSPESLDAASVDPATAANPTATLDTRALVEASRNLTQKLKQLSSEENAKRRQGAIIESMHHHGKGVYTGTFSGTLNPALQDRHGRPKRDISTIIHILNDLLCATPATTAGHYRYHRHPSAHRATSTSTNPASASNATAAAAAAAVAASQTSSMFAVSSNGSVATTAVGASSALEPTAACTESPNPGYSNEELSKENEATKGKLRRLRLVMEQRREKMRARRQARAAPYTTKWAAVTPDPDPNASSSSTTSGSGSGKSSGESQNEPELQPCSPEPVVA